ncbi:hydantoinase B/oxoprolinase family protein [Paradesulfitobacterium ferrireducens]|uniref:hydantoinase B/oxoprolinase family protein n=1 Tax=Paradesulfitobacterium ferrireducens TaxID=2816476 RepID=UPI001A8D7031|nr:hydantoinase B/oxoprolinase family protein [Paradesulfitobacterium ferrireducens]
MAGKIDPILVAVLDNRFSSICVEIGQTMLRTSRSPIFSEARDFVSAIFDRRGRLIAQKDYIPVLSGAAPFALRAIADHFKGRIYEGDVYVLNDPYRGNNHPPDITVVKPVFFEGELAFWSMAKGHHVDVGGGGVGGYNPLATDAWTDALRIPPVKLYERGVKQQDIWDMILINVHIPFLVEGDLHCQVGATTIGERSLTSMARKYGMDTLEAVIEEIFDAYEAKMRAEIRSIPNGTYYAERKIDHDGIDTDKPVTVRLALSVHDEDVVYDYSATDHQVKGFLNSTYPNTVSSSYISLFTTIKNKVKINEGSIRPVTVIAPEGSLLNPLEPAPTTASTVPTAETIAEAGWYALAQAVPNLCQAAWNRWAAPASGGVNPRTEKPFGDIHFMSKGGGGATEGIDGWDHLGTVICLGGLRAPDPELHEMVTPYLILNYELMPDNAGAGQWRGGNGLHYKWQVLGDNVAFAMFGSGVRDETAPFGLAGGKGAPKTEQYLIKADSTRIWLDVNTFVYPEKGDCIEIFSSGGGGYGDPFKRSTALVLEDVQNELLSIEAAKAQYGVVIDPETLTVNQTETDKLRSKGV